MLRGILDTTFATFITPRIVRAQWTTCLIVAGIIVFLLLCENVYALISFIRDQNRGVSMLLATVALDVIVPLFIWTFLLTVRLFLEAIMVAFRCEEHLRVLANRARVVSPPGTAITP